MTAPGERWAKAVEEAVKINGLYAKLAKKPDAKVFRTLLSRIHKSIGFSLWVEACAEPQDDARLLVVRREISKALRGGDLSEDRVRELVESYRVTAQAILETAAPEHFQFSGFHIYNPDRVCESFCKRVLSGLDYLIALFKNRGMSKLLDDSIRQTTLSIEKDFGAATLHAGTRELTLSVPRLIQGKGRFIEWVNETFLHEFGHYIHRNYLPPEAERVWNQPWDEAGLESLARPYTPDDEARARKLAPLDVVTDYARVDKYEDFAETFLVFMVAPEKLTPNAKYRMQRALSISGLYGKPVMHYSYDRRMASWFPRAVDCPAARSPVAPHRSRSRVRELGVSAWGLALKGGKLPLNP